MAKIKDLDANMEEVLNGSNVKQESEDKLINTTLRNIPRSWTKILKAEGFTFAGYAKNAIRQAMIRDGFIK